MKKIKKPDPRGTRRKKAASGSPISDRDRSTILRLRNRLGRDGLVQLVDSEPQLERKPGPRGAPRMHRTRQCLLAILYQCRLSKGQITIPAFARRLQKVVKIEYSRRSPPAYLTYGSLTSLEADLRRGLRETDRDAYLAGFSGLFLWRFNLNQLNERVGYYSFGSPHLRVTPKKPAELIGWIDAAIESAGFSEQAFRQLYQAAPPKIT